GGCVGRVRCGGRLGGCFLVSGGCIAVVCGGDVAAGELLLVLDDDHLVFGGDGEVPLYLVDLYCVGVVCFGDGLQAETYLPRFSSYRCPINS
ncbi:hypothetical protein A2U01_0052955, partial [Trifolium medium]|nr:hypothetical protein [Trifolium medium]